MDQIDWPPISAAQSWNTLLPCMQNCCSAWVHSSPLCPAEWHQCSMGWCSMGLPQAAADPQTPTGRLRHNSYPGKPWEKHHFHRNPAENCSEPSLICSHGFQLQAKLIKYQRQRLRETSDTLIGPSHRKYIHHTHNSTNLSSSPVPNFKQGTQ